MNYIYLFAGIIAFNLLRLNSAWNKKDFSWTIFAKENLISVVVALMLGSVIVLSKSITDEVIEMTFAGAIININIYIIIGIGIDTLVKKIYEIANPNKSTGIGVNKK